MANQDDRRIAVPGRMSLMAGSLRQRRARQLRYRARFFVRRDRFTPLLVALRYDARHHDRACAGLTVRAQ